MSDSAAMERLLRAIEEMPPSLTKDKTAMMLRLVPDTRTAAERCQYGDSDVGQCVANSGHRSDCVYEYQLRPLGTVPE